MKTRYFALIVGIIFLLIGLAGFVPGLLAPIMGSAPPLEVDSGYGYLLGLFPINVLHNIVHLLVGVLGVVSYRTYDTARLYARGLTIVYTVLAIMGLIPVLNTTFGLIPLFGHNIWLHALTALIAAYFGFVTNEQPAYTREVRRV